jgi:hypothetical protein
VAHLYDARDRWKKSTSPHPSVQLTHLNQSYGETAWVETLGATANVAGDEIDVVAVQHVIGVHLMLAQFSRMDTCFHRMDREISKARTLGAAMQTDILAALRRLVGLLSVAGTQ